MLPGIVLKGYLPFHAEQNEGNLMNGSNIGPVHY